MSYLNFQVPEELKKRFNVFKAKSGYTSAEALANLLLMQELAEIARNSRHSA